MVNGAVDPGLAEAQARMGEVCRLLIRGDLTGMEEARGHVQHAIEILSGWRPVEGAPTPRRNQLHRSVERAGRLMESVGQWCQHRRVVLFPDEATPPCYGADGRAVVGTIAGSTALRG